MEDKTLSTMKRLQIARAAVQESGLKKTGFNQFSNYYYFQLEDFLPNATRVFKEVGLTPVFTLQHSDSESGISRDYAELTIYNSDNPDDHPLSFQCPYADANNSKNPVQNLGSTITYLRRYLYMMALDLSETDIIDSTSGSPEDHSSENAKKRAMPNISGKQAELIQKLYTPEEIKTMMRKLKHNDLTECTAVEAAKMIDFKKKGETNGNGN